MCAKNCTRKCTYVCEISQVHVRDVSFSEHFANVLKEWSHTSWKQKKTVRFSDTSSGGGIEHWEEIG